MSYGAHVYTYALHRDPPSAFHMGSAAWHDREFCELQFMLPPGLGEEHGQEVLEGWLRKSGYSWLTRDGGVWRADLDGIREKHEVAFGNAKWMTGSIDVQPKFATEGDGGHGREDMTLITFSFVGPPEG